MKKISEVPSVYVCGPLTDLLPDKQKSVKRIYVQIARLAQRITGVRGFVPHEHCDPKIHSYLQPEQVDLFERDRISKKTSCLVALVIAPSWGGGIEIEIAHQNKVPCILLIKKGENTSRLLRGNPGIAKIIQYTSVKDVLIQLTDVLKKYKKNFFRQSKVKSSGWNKQIVRSQRLLKNQSLAGFPCMKEGIPKNYRDKKYLILESTGVRMIGMIDDSSVIVNGDPIWESLGGIYCDLTSIAAWHLINDKSAYVPGIFEKNIQRLYLLDKVALL